MALIQHNCHQCGVEYHITDTLEQVLRQSSQIFYCPFGHKAWYPPKEAVDRAECEKAALRQERDRLAQRIAQKDDEIAWQKSQREQAERRVSAAKGQVTKLKNRAAAGVCPCCNRSFENLHRHMTTKHPDFKDTKRDADNIVPLKRA
jgi:hypothetical protein